MKIIKRCSGCNSWNIKGSISIKDSEYIQKINCLDCGYKNNQVIGSAEIPPEEDEEDE